MLSVYGVIFHLFQEILIKKKQMAEAEVAEAEAGGYDGNFSWLNTPTEIKHELKLNSHSVFEKI